MSGLLLSVIVPAFNAESHIERCLESLCGFVDEGVEVIIVNDGSTDQTAEIAEQFRNSEPYFRVIHQENRGLSGARNVGMSVARGAFGLFLDSDDEIDLPRLLSEIIPRAISGNLDAVLFDTEPYSDDPTLDGLVARYRRYYSRNLIGNGAQRIGPDLMNALLSSGGYLPSACLYVWRASYLREMAISFVEGVIMEDNGFSFVVFSGSDRVGYVPAKVHRRRVRRGSITQASPASDKVTGLVSAYLQCASVIKNPESTLPWQTKVLNGLVANVRELTN